MIIPSPEDAFSLANVEEQPRQGRHFCSHSRKQIISPNISSERGKADLRGKAEKGLALKHSKG
ncbi:MAG: hypothetical protein BWX84_00649 [Verrucomicrobia bacterium ADurb.Bin118]|jgi:hypothetical protein|nr:MAG: hypothetical protein BWX84_00649 [Verrucomicrobia bacterium ADurb.Bin118]